MRLIEPLAWLLVVVVLVAIGIGKLNFPIESCQPQSAERTKAVDGQQVPYWTRTLNGRPVVVYQCPGEQPEIAGSFEGVRCD
jgi:hypothetical protein